METNEPSWFSTNLLWDPNIGIGLIDDASSVLIDLVNTNYAFEISLEILWG
jgi:hypothetical protein